MDHINLPLIESVLVMTTFEQLTPETIFPVVEHAIGKKLTGLCSPLPSYINRVYELRTNEGEKLIVKFYRPGRWSREAIFDEHRFVADCSDAEIPVVPPLQLQNGESLGEFNETFFAVYPKRAGRQFEINYEQDWLRIGSLIGRIHCAGARRTAHSRITIHPQHSTRADVSFLCDHIIPGSFRESYRTLAMRIITVSTPLFENLETIRIHGDCHRGNILDRLEEGLQVIDFDDMAMGPPVQDLWLLLPDRITNAQREVELFLEGYERFRVFNRVSLACIESLRAMRMIYFLAWCSKQMQDLNFKKTFPDWGSDSFWQREINDLREQAGFIMETAF